MAQNAAASGLFIHGQRESGQDVRIGNVTAALAVANIVKSSLGPVGLDKMLVDDIGDVLITNDGATILRQLEVEHPAARVLVDLAQLQDSEVGDGTTSVVIVASELLRRGNELVKNGLHPTTIISGYRQALKAAVSFLKKEMVVNVNDLDDTHLINAAKTSMSSKIIGNDSDFFAKLAVDAVKSVKMRSSQAEIAGLRAAASSASATSENNTSNTSPDANSSANPASSDATAPHASNKPSSTGGGKERYKYPISAIHILKAHGKSSRESYLVNGFAVNAMRAAQGMPTFVEDSENGIKIAMLDMNLQRHRMAMGVQVIVKDPKEIENIKKREMDITKERIQKILDTGVKVVLTTKGIDDLCLKYFVEAGVICARRCNREDLKRLAKATGGKVVVTMADMDGNETFDTDCLGVCDAVKEERISDQEVLYMYGCKGSGASTIVLRGANEYMLDEIDRALHDSLCVTKRMLESNTLVAGGGAVETALSVYLGEYANTLDTREQLAIQEFAEALLVIPKTLAVNAAKDSSELVAKLRAVHAKNQFSSSGEDSLAKHTGLDLIQGEIRENLTAGVVEPAISKIKSLRFATEAAITILRIDDRITLQDKQQMM